MKTLILLSIAFVGLTASFAAQANTCSGSCMNIGGNPSYDRFCESVANSGGGQLVCNQYESLGCAWIVPPPGNRQGNCLNAGPSREHDAICLNAGMNQGAIGCQRYRDLGCIWVANPGSCE